jgi:hypothetical protein
MSLDHVQVCLSLCLISESCSSYLSIPCGSSTHCEHNCTKSFFPYKLKGVMCDKKKKRSYSEKKNCICQIFLVIVY